MELEPVTPVDNPATTPTSASTYEWLSANPLASSCGVTLSNIYCASRDYNRLTQCTIGSVESIVGYAAGTAKPVYEKVVEKLDTPLTTVDSALANQLVKLEDKYPVIGEQPGEIATKGKDTVYSTLQAGQETLGNTRAGRLVGYSADVTITLAEQLVEKMLPADDLDDKEVEEQEEEEEKEEEASSVGGEKRSLFGLRKRKTASKKEPEAVIDNETTEEKVESYHVETVPRTTRVYTLSQKVCYRSLHRVQRLQKQCMSSLEKLQASIDLLRCAQMVSGKLGEQKESMVQALKDAEERFKRYLCKQVKEEKEMSGLVTEEGSEGDEDIKWLLESGNKKDLYQRALEYSKVVSEKVHQLMQSLAGVTSYLPQGLRDGANNTIKQAKDVYTTLKENNVPSELPRFMLSQVSEIVDVQIVYCKQLGVYLTTIIKQRFGKCDSISTTPGSCDEVELEDNEETIVDPEDGEVESGSETVD